MANLDNPRVQHSSVIEPGAYNNTPGAVQARPTSYSTGTNDITCPSANQVNVARRRSTLWTLNLRQPIWTDAQVDPIDGKYFHFFLLHMNHHVIYGDLFPNLMTEVFARTLQSKPLRHAVLAVSAALVDEYLQRPAVRALVHKQQAITSLQQSLGTGDITEEVAISIFILLSMDAFNSFDIPQSHLRGFGLVLKELRLDWDDPLIWNKASPVLMLVWRMATRLDSGVALVQRALPVLPHCPAENIPLHRTWALTLAKDGRSADWALASFALDDINHCAIHWTLESAIVRATAEYINNAEIRDAYELLMQQRMERLCQEHANWLQQPVCMLAMQMELLAQSREVPSNSIKFLDYPPLVIYDSKFTHLLNQWRSTAIFLSLRSQDSLQRSCSQINHAIEICRTHIAKPLPSSNPDLVAEVFALISTSYVFGGGIMYKSEFKWVHDRISEVCMIKHPVLSSFQTFLDGVRLIHAGFPEWASVDDISAVE